MKVLIDEEYGYRLWFWYPNMEKEQLIEWWKSQETVKPFFMNPSDELSKLGKIEVIEGCSFLGLDANADADGRAHLHCDDDSWLIIDEVAYHHAGYDRQKIIDSL